MKLIRVIIIVLGLALVWQLIIILFTLPPYILPGPIVVIKTWWQQSGLIFHQATFTIIEALLGLLLGTLFGMLSALIMVYFRPARLWFLPILLISQALPTFAIAPLLVVWFGYGMASKIVTTIIMLFFPITNALYDGLNQINPGWLDLAKTMNGLKWRILWHIKMPAAMPSLATGVRVATAIAPIGAVVGEWVGASKGLGFLMLNANARMQIDLMFAALFTITIFTIVLYFAVDKLLQSMVFWK
jgi:putative hydroxymethylpyrimidine transport system permease protein